MFSSIKGDIMTFQEWKESMKPFKKSTIVDGHVVKTIFEDGTEQFAFVYEKNNQKFVKIIDMTL